MLKTTLKTVSYASVLALTPFHPSTPEAKADTSEFEASMDYTVTSMPSRAETNNEPVTYTHTKKETNKNYSKLCLTIFFSDGNR